MLKYPCLVLDHDDTVVQSESTVNYPYFCYILDQFRPGATITLDEYVKGCFHPGFVGMCQQRYNFTDEELKEEYQGWKEYVRSHIPAPYSGIERIIRRQKEEGGMICVVSHSAAENIARDYKTHFGILLQFIHVHRGIMDKKGKKLFPFAVLIRRSPRRPHRECPVPQRERPRR